MFATIGFIVFFVVFKYIVGDVSFWIAALIGAVGSVFGALVEMGVNKLKKPKIDETV